MQHFILSRLSAIHIILYINHPVRAKKYIYSYISTSILLPNITLLGISVFYSLSWIFWIPAILSFLHLHTVIYLLHSSSSLASTFFILIFFYCLHLLLASTIFNLVFFTTSRICFFIILLYCTLKYNLHLFIWQSILYFFLILHLYSSVSQ